MADNLKQGDTVVLNSGGPVMVVVGGQPDALECAWAERDRKTQAWSYQSTELPEACLRKVDIPPPDPLSRELKAEEHESP